MTRRQRAKRVGLPACTPATAERYDDFNLEPKAKLRKLIRAIIAPDAQLAAYEANRGEMAATNSTGRVTVEDVPGEVAIMVRFQGNVDVFRAVIPQGLEVRETPPEKNFVDTLVFNKLKALGIPPSGLCDDAAFIRRATIDITGRLPTPQEVDTFLADPTLDKRDRLVDELIDSPGYADYFANKWSAVLRNRRRNNNDIPYTWRFQRRPRFRTPAIALPASRLSFRSNQ